MEATLDTPHRSTPPRRDLRAVQSRAGPEPRVGDKVGVSIDAAAVQVLAE